MDASVIWKENLLFTSTDPDRMSILLDGEVSTGESGQGFEPMRLVAIGLAGCTAMDVISIMQKKRQEVTAFEVQVHADRATEFPKVFTKIIIEYIVEGKNIDPAAVERSIELSATKYCPVQAMLRKACQIEHKYTIKNATN